MGADGGTGAAGTGSGAGEGSGAITSTSVRKALVPSPLPSSMGAVIEGGAGEEITGVIEIASNVFVTVARLVAVAVGCGENMTDFSSCDARLPSSSATVARSSSSRLTASTVYIETSTSVATEANAVVSSSKSSWAVIMRVQLLSLAKDCIFSSSWNSVVCC